MVTGTPQWTIWLVRGTEMKAQNKPGTHLWAIMFIYLLQNCYFKVHTCRVYMCTELVNSPKQVASVSFLYPLQMNPKYETTEIAQAN